MAFQQMNFECHSPDCSLDTLSSALGYDVRQPSTLILPHDPNDDVPTPSTTTRAFWMQDKYCPCCFECQAKFSLFRRRHHCRLCGHVFCGRCAPLLPAGQLLMQQARLCTACATRIRVQETQRRVPVADPLGRGGAPRSPFFRIASAPTKRALKRGQWQKSGSAMQILHVCLLQQQQQQQGAPGQPTAPRVPATAGGDPAPSRRSRSPSPSDDRASLASSSRHAPGSSAPGSSRHPDPPSEADEETVSDVDSEEADAGAAGGGRPAAPTKGPALGHAFFSRPAAGAAPPSPTGSKQPPEKGTSGGGGGGGARVSAFLGMVAGPPRAAAGGAPAASEPASRDLTIHVRLSTALPQTRPAPRSPAGAPAIPTAIPPQAALPPATTTTPIPIPVPITSTGVAARAIPVPPPPYAASPRSPVTSVSLLASAQPTSPTASLLSPLVRARPPPPGIPARPPTPPLRSSEGRRQTPGGADLPLWLSPGEVDLQQSWWRVRPGRERAIQAMADAHFVGVVKTLAAQCYGLSDQWVRVILSLAAAAIRSTPLDITHGDSLDLGAYVRVKTLPDPSAPSPHLHSCLVRGVVLRAGLVHRGMPTRVDRPRVLLFTCPLQYWRAESRPALLQPAIEQEAPYLHLLAAKILSVSPSIVACSRGAAHLLQELLAAHGVALMVNVPPKALARLSFALGAPLLDSPDDISLGALGTCTAFRQYTFPACPRPPSVAHPHPTPGCPPPTATCPPGPQHPQPTSGCTQLAVFDGCAAPLAATLVLWGRPDVLPRAKALARFALYAGHALVSEAAYLIATGFDPAHCPPLHYPPPATPPAVPPVPLTAPSTAKPALPWTDASTHTLFGHGPAGLDPPGSLDPAVSPDALLASQDPALPRYAPLAAPARPAPGQRPLPAAPSLADLLWEEESLLACKRAKATCPGGIATTTPGLGGIATVSRGIATISGGVATISTNPSLGGSGDEMMMVDCSPAQPPPLMVIPPGLPHPGTGRMTGYLPPSSSATPEEEQADVDSTQVITTIPPPVCTTTSLFVRVPPNPRRFAPPASFPGAPANPLVPVPRHTFVYLPPTLCERADAVPAVPRPVPYEGLPDMRTGQELMVLFSQLSPAMKALCTGFECKMLNFYRGESDMPLLAYLRTKLGNLTACPKCGRTPLDHREWYDHGRVRVEVTLERSALPPPSAASHPFLTWTTCRACQRHLTPRQEVTGALGRLSFAKFLEGLMYPPAESDACSAEGMSTPAHGQGPQGPQGQHHCGQLDLVRWFQWQDIVCRVETSPLSLFAIVPPAPWAAYEPTVQGSLWAQTRGEINRASTEFFGAIATRLQRYLGQGHKVVEVLGRDEAHGAALAQDLKTAFDRERSNFGMLMAMAGHVLELNKLRRHLATVSVTFNTSFSKLHDILQAETFRAQGGLPGLLAGLVAGTPAPSRALPGSGSGDLWPEAPPGLAIGSVRIPRPLSPQDRNPLEVGTVLSTAASHMDEGGLFGKSVSLPATVDKVLTASRPAQQQTAANPTPIMGPPGARTTAVRSNSVSALAAPAAPPDQAARSPGWEKVTMDADPFDPAYFFPTRRHRRSETISGGPPAALVPAPDSVRSAAVRPAVPATPAAAAAAAVPGVVAGLGPEPGEEDDVTLAEAEDALQRLDALFNEEESPVLVENSPPDAAAAPLVADAQQLEQQQEPAHAVPAPTEGPDATTGGSEARSPGTGTPQPTSLLTSLLKMDQPASTSPSPAPTPLAEHPPKSRPAPVPGRAAASSALFSPLVSGGLDSPVPGWAGGHSMPTVPPPGGDADSTTAPANPRALTAPATTLKTPAVSKKMFMVPRMDAFEPLPPVVYGNRATGYEGAGHILLPLGHQGDVVAVYDTEASTQIAYTLVSERYHEHVAGLLAQVTTAAAPESGATATPPPPDASAPPGVVAATDPPHPDAPPTSAAPAGAPSTSPYLPPAPSPTSLSSGSTEAETHPLDPAASPLASPAPAAPADRRIPEPPPPRPDALIKDQAMAEAAMLSEVREDLVMSFGEDGIGEDGEDGRQFTCTVYYPLQFHALRAQCCSNDHFIRSLSRCVGWSVKGGKSGSVFCRTIDERFVVKSVKQGELENFLGFAPHYFRYLHQVLFRGLPSVMARLLGVYTVVTQHKRDTHKTCLVVMENLFYQRPHIRRIYDLKGSERARYAKDKTAAGAVHMDENLLEIIQFGKPFMIESAARTHLEWCLYNDTCFLASRGLVDYSLVVGVDEVDRTLVLGIIDYLRLYQTVERVETMLKRSGFGTKSHHFSTPAGSRVDPTVVPPDRYRDRFRNAMRRYFVKVPDRHTKVAPPPASYGVNDELDADDLRAAEDFSPPIESSFARLRINYRPAREGCCYSGGSDDAPGGDAPGVERVPQVRKKVYTRAEQAAEFEKWKNGQLSEFPAVIFRGAHLHKGFQKGHDACHIVSCEVVKAIFLLSRPPAQNPTVRLQNVTIQEIEDIRASMSRADNLVGKTHSQNVGPDPDNDRQLDGELIALFKQDPQDGQPHSVVQPRPAVLSRARLQAAILRNSLARRPGIGAIPEVVLNAARRFYTHIGAWPVENWHRLQPDDVPRLTPEERALADPPRA
ncbi:putative 1-phosphatidylinositol 3-phosphate 5-kinase FAB1 [Paratrimastix pyriformis]|uniref:1-phosphatidylinositol-3-phosphate 5-kinase n=1 Tax=Paratrimastix pyriformis TaxID=342808 RepID=A0ABQ8UHQ3_9EUKA|nr:putative 1-phosphatidylinositol 3-phosphate 5-kinase FAB1 [Paratrimastix pyriformis]